MCNSEVNESGTVAGELYSKNEIITCQNELFKIKVQRKYVLYIKNPKSIAKDPKIDHKTSKLWTCNKDCPLN